MFFFQSHDLSASSPCLGLDNNFLKNKVQALRRLDPSVSTSYILPSYERDSMRIILTKGQAPTGEENK